MVKQPASGLEITTPATARRVLDNGMEVIVREDHSSPVVALQIWVRAGSIYEEEWLGAGVSHYVEHLAFKGPEGEGKGEIPRQIQSLGGEVNAYTSLEHTVFYVKIPSEHWREALDLLRKLVLEVGFQAEEVAQEKEVILKEINMGLDDPARRLDRLLWSTAFRVHPYRYPVIGYRDILQQLSREDVFRYYQKWYIPNNMFLVAVGDLRMEALFRAASEIFGPYPRKPYPVADIPSEPPQLSPREAEESMDITQTRLALAFHIPSLHHPDLYPLDVLAILVGKGKSSSLYQKVREQMELVHSIYAYSYTPAYPGLFMVRAETDPEKAIAARSVILEVLEGYKSGEISPEELERARTQVISDYLHSLTTVEGQARDIGSNQLLTGSWDFSRYYVEGISSVRAEDIRRVARKYLNEDNMTVAVIRPPRPPSVSLPAAAPSEGEIQKFELDNGLTLLLREDHSLPLVSIRMVFEGGVLAENEKNNGSCHLLSRMLLKGTKHRSAPEIAREIENKGGSITTYSARNSFGCSLEVLSDQLTPALEVLSDVVQNCTFPELEIEKERKITLAQIEAEKDEPRKLASRLFREMMFINHPYRFSPLGSESSVKSLTREDLMDFYKRYCCAQNGVLAVFGDVKTQNLLPLLRAGLGELREGEKAKLTGNFDPASKAVREKVEAKNDIEQAVLLLGFSGTDVYDRDRYTLELLSSAFSGLSAPLFLKIRDEMGLAYYIGAYQILGLDPGAYIFYAGTVPGQTGTVLSAIREEISRIKNGGITSEELKRNKNRLLGQHRFGLQSNSELAFRAALDELYGLGYDTYIEYEDRIKAVTGDDLKKVARKYFLDDDYALVIVQPEQQNQVISGQ